jgi:hypothetical protein
MLESLDQRLEDERRFWLLQILAVFFEILFNISEEGSLSEVKAAFGEKILLGVFLLLLPEI